MNKLRIHCFQHVDFEGLGSIEQWCHEKGHTITYTRFYEEFDMPDLQEIDWLIVMGGPMSVNDVDVYPWLKGEKEAISRAIEMELVVIGICLGAQIIASVLGAEIYPNKHKEIGWFDLQMTESGRNHPLFAGFGDVQKVFHWHGETFTLPAGSTLLASSEGCMNQAFLYGDNVLGLQFHFEITQESLEKMVKNCGHELTDGVYIQKREELMSHQTLIALNNSMMNAILNHMADRS
jgi:GMP synthase-like glutamine amidotransferase